MIQIIVTTGSVSDYYRAEITDGSTTMDLGLLDDAERADLANQFREAADELMKGLEDD